MYCTERETFIRVTEPAISGGTLYTDFSHFTFLLKYNKKAEQPPATHSDSYPALLITVPPYVKQILFPFRHADSS